MTPQEKASSLCKKFNLISHKDKWETTSYTLLSLDSAKELALKAVDEILYELDHIPASNETREYWEEVKEEIKKL